jgi:hypothetical protein
MTTGGKEAASVLLHAMVGELGENTVCYLSIAMEAINSVVDKGLYVVFAGDGGGAKSKSLSALPILLLSQDSQVLFFITRVSSDDLVP